VQLLLEKDREYLAEILSDLGIRVERTDDLTVDKVCALMSNQTSSQIDPRESSIYKCSCGSRFITVREVQMRSADEGSAVVCMCRACGRKW
jgi:DNA-directed RNA polymerase subunit M/transcription elongation factor TFIIS